LPGTLTGIAGKSGPGEGRADHEIRPGLLLSESLTFAKKHLRKEDSHVLFDLTSIRERRFPDQPAVHCLKAPKLS
jgi:hypothetical protein